MSETTSPGRYQETNQREDPVAVAQPRSKRRRWVAAKMSAQARAYDPKRLAFPNHGSSRHTL